MFNCFFVSYFRWSWLGGDMVFNFRRFKYIVYRVWVVILIVGFFRFFWMRLNFDWFYRFFVFVSVWYWFDVIGVEMVIVFFDICVRWFDVLVYR